MGTDSLYYIMDYSGHYYRTNQADQLVAAAGEQEATVFTLAQANRHIGVGKKASFYCMVPIEEQTESITDEVVSPIKELTYDEVTEPVEKKVASYDLWFGFLLTFYMYTARSIRWVSQEMFLIKIAAVLMMRGGWMKFVLRTEMTTSRRRRKCHLR